MIRNIRDFEGNLPGLAVVLFWKLLTALGTGLLVYVQVAQSHIDLFGRIAISVLSLGWLLMFLFMEPDVR